MTCNLQNIYLKARSYKIHPPCITKTTTEERNVKLLFAIVKIVFITKGSLQKYISSCWYLWRYVLFHCTCVECNGMYSFFCFWHHVQFLSSLCYNALQSIHLHGFFRCITKYMCKLYYPLASASPKKALLVCVMIMVRSFFFG